MKAGGAFESIVLNGRQFSCDAESEPEVDINDYENEVKPNSDGTFRISKTRKVNSIEGLTISINTDTDDLEFIKDLNARLEPFSISATRVDGGVYSGEVMLTDDLKYNEKEETMEITLQGRIERL